MFGTAWVVCDDLSGGYIDNVNEKVEFYKFDLSNGSDVELRREMWKLVSELKSQGVTIILTTHYIEEAEAIADRVGVISNGKLILLEEKKALIKRMGQKKLEISEFPKRFWFSSICEEFFRFF